MKVAMLGLGTMGGGMAGCLIKAGFDVAVWNRKPEKMTAFGSAGARVATSPRDAVRDAEVVVAMLADDNAARSVWLGENGALHGAKAGAVLIDSSTISPPLVRDLAAEAKLRKCEFLDAPVTGSKTQAAAGELRFLVGGDASTLDRARPVLSAMGTEIVHFGPVGSGAVMKLINNFVCGVQAAALAEAIAFIERTGLERDKALSILLNGAPASPLVKAVSARMVARDYTVHFVLDLMQKDLSYAIAEAERHKLTLLTPAAARRLMEQASAKGFGQHDFSAVIEPLRL